MRKASSVYGLQPDQAEARIPNLKRKTAAVCAVLEKTQGIPVWAGPSDPVACLVETILSQSTSDRNRDRAYKELIKRYPGWAEMAAAQPARIADAIRVAGLANQKSVRIRDVLKWINKSFGGYQLDWIHGKSDDDVLEILCTQKGIGVKTASIVLLFACGRDIFPVDTHVHRICGRLGLIGPKTAAEKAFWELRPLVPEGKGYSLHLNMIRFGREICHARNPACDRCPLRRRCVWRKSRDPKGFQNP